MLKKYQIPFLICLISDAVGGIIYLVFNAFILPRLPEPWQSGLLSAIVGFLAALGLFANLIQVADFIEQRLKPREDTLAEKYSIPPRAKYFVGREKELAEFTRNCMSAKW